MFVWRYRFLPVPAGVFAFTVSITFFHVLFAVSGQGMPGQFFHFAHQGFLEFLELVQRHGLFLRLGLVKDARSVPVYFYVLQGRIPVGKIIAFAYQIPVTVQTVFSQYGNAGAPGPLVQEPSVSQIIPGVPVPADEYLVKLPVPDGEQVGDPVVLAGQQFRLSVPVAVQQLVLRLFQSLGRGLIPHAFPDGHQIIPFLSEEDIAAAPLPPSGCRSSFDSSPLGTC